MRTFLTTLLGCCLLVATLLPLAQAERLPSQAASSQTPLSGFGSLPENNPSHPTAVPSKSGRENSKQEDLSSLAGSGENATGSAFVEAQTALNKENLSAMPTLTQFQMMAREESEEHFESIPVRQGEPGKAGPISPPLESAARAVVRPSSEAPAGPNDMTYFTTHNITSSEVSTTQRSTIQEPSVVNLNSTVFFTANWYAAKSTNSGASFTYVNPYTLFPSINNGFCCDQVTAYAPNQDMALWGLQYIKDGSSGTFRLARALGAGGVSADNWVYYDFNPQMVGFASGNWFDYPSMTVGANFLYVTSNVFRTSDDGFTGSVVMRLPLSNLAAATGFSFNYFSSPSQGTFRCTEGATTTMYFASFNTTSQMRIHRWDESSTTIFWDDVNLNAFTFLSRNGVATSPDGTNWAARGDSRPLGAYVANGIIGVMFMARQDGTFPYPYSIHARFNQSNRALVTQGQIWNPNYAWLYPSAAVNASGNLAGTLQIGGGTVANGFPYPGTQVWIIDDIQPMINNQVGGLYFLSSSNAGPSNNAWGDFFTVRPHKTFPNTWVSASHSLSNGQSGSNTIPNYTWFGRGRDASICSYGISPTSASVAATGGTGTVNVTAGSGCAWSAFPNATWISVTAGSSGSGNGPVSYAVQANNTTVARSGTITIAGLTFTVNQAAGTAASGLRFFPLLSPIRLLDTRPGESACDAPAAPLVGGGVRTVQARTTCSSVPATAQAITGNMAVVNTLAGSGSGYITLFPSSVTQPFVANVNYTPGQIINNYFTVALASDGRFSIYAFTSTHLVMDITGYYAP